MYDTVNLICFLILDQRTYSW